MLDDQPPPHLDYAKPLPLAWASRHKKLLISLSILLATSVFIYENYQPLKFRVLWLYWSHRAANYQMPGGIDITIFDATKARATLAANPEYATTDLFAPYSRGKAIYYPRAWRELRDFDPRWRNNWQDPVAFLGTLHRPDGKPRIVGIAGDNLNALDLLYTLQTIVVEQPGFFSSVPAVETPRGFAWNGPWVTARLKSGVRDPNDPSHLTFDVTIPSVSPTKPATIFSMEMYLQNDDSLLFKLHNTVELEQMNVRLTFNVELGEEFQQATISGPHR